MENYAIDLNEWIPRFPLNKVEQDWVGINGATQMICSPGDLAGMEQIRSKVAQKRDLGAKVACDVFLWSDGEPERRWATKIGGLPYRPRTMPGRFGRRRNPWPMNDFNEPKTFLAQFCFADSKDVVGELPGDVLLLFIDSEDCDEESFIFEWYELGLSDLISADELPDQPGAKNVMGEPWIRPCYGHIHRTWDYPEAGAVFRDSGYEEGQILAVSRATKIGGVPPWIRESDTQPGSCLCTLNSLQIIADQCSPWVNRSEPYTDDELGGVCAFDPLMLGDMGSLYFFIDDESLIHVGEQCY